MRAIKKPVLALVAAVLLLLVILVGGVALWTNTAISPSREPIPFEIKPGGLSSIISQLHAQGVDVNGSLFTLLVRASGNTKKLKAGYYELKPGESPYKLMDRMVRGLFSYESLTIPEGWTFKQMRGAINAHARIRHDTANMTEGELMDALGVSGKAEGQFFPDTYLFIRGSSDMQIYRQAQAQLKKRLDSYWEKRDPALPYKTPYEALIMASIVEKETGMPADRGKIAGVFINRLKVGMKLQTDPTVIYGMGDKYKGTIYRSSLQTDTPYNTYTRFGLPPTPIALVGDAALRAAFYPEKTDALYFVAKGDGSSEFTTNLGDHNKAVDKFLRNKDQNETSQP